MTATPRACDGKHAMRRLLCLLALGLGAACSGAPPEPVAPPPAPPPPPPATVPLPAPVAEVPVVDAGPPEPAPPPPPPAPLACPPDMKLVDGDYCHEVEHKCLKSWYDKSNKKTILRAVRAGIRGLQGAEDAPALLHRHLRVAQPEG